MEKSNNSTMVQRHSDIGFVMSDRHVQVLINVSLVRRLLTNRSMIRFAFFTKYIYKLGWGSGELCVGVMNKNIPW